MLNVMGNGMPAVLVAGAAAARNRYADRPSRLVDFRGYNPTNGGRPPRTGRSG